MTDGTLFHYSVVWTYMVESVVGKMLMIDSIKYKCGYVVTVDTCCTGPVSEHHVYSTGSWYCGQFDGISVWEVIFG